MSISQLSRIPKWFIHQNYWSSNNDGTSEGR